MKIYKIGRYYYKEISEQKYVELYNEKSEDIVTLIDYGGEPIKYFKKQKIENLNKKIEK